MDFTKGLRIRDIRDPRERWKLTAYECAFRLFCRHRQGPKPNVLLICTRRSGSTWVLNTLAAHPKMRHVGRPFMMSLFSRWRHEIPSLAEAAEYRGDYDFELFVHFEGDAEQRFRDFARCIVLAERHIYPGLRFWSSYFHRVTDRVVFQITQCTALIEWFDEHFPVDILVLLRHPIPNALSIMARGWRPECRDFLNHSWFVETQLTGPQVDLARRTVNGGSPLAKHVLDWTFKMLMPVRAVQSGRHPHWLTITYEQLVWQPTEILELISERLDLPDIDAMRAQVPWPSRTVTQGTAEKVDDAHYLLRRWRSRVSKTEEEEVMRIPETFGIDAYRAGRFVPTDPYLHGTLPDGA